MLKFVLPMALLLGGAAPAWADAWGAIAIDQSQPTKEPGYGIGGGDSENEAKGNALKFCRESGTVSGCKIMVTYQSCGAIASNGHDIGWAMAPTKKDVEINAIKACGKDDCQSVTSDCN